MAEIHPSAIVSRESQVAHDANIGPGCVLTGKVVIRPGVRLVANVQLNGPVDIGAGTIVYPFACLGFPGQDFKFKMGMPTPGVKIGANCIIREHVTVHAATKEEAPTTIGDGVFMMVASHAGHDVKVGNNVIMVNASLLAGHSTVFDGATIGGGCAVHQFTRIGRMAFMSGGASVSMDVPPFCIVSDRQRIAGINRVGLRRSGMPREHITKLDEAFRKVFRAHVPRPEMVQILEELGKDCPPVMEMAQFVKDAKRAICPGPGRPPRLMTTWLHHSRRGTPIPDDTGDESDGL